MSDASPSFFELRSVECNMYSCPIDFAVLGYGKITSKPTPPMIVNANSAMFLNCHYRLLLAQLEPLGYLLASLLS
jgi:hypothetical protein